MKGMFGNSSKNDSSRSQDEEEVRGGADATRSKGGPAIGGFLPPSAEDPRSLHQGNQDPPPQPRVPAVPMPGGGGGEVRGDQQVGEGVFPPSPDPMPLDPTKPLPHPRPQPSRLETPQLFERLSGAKREEAQNMVTEFSKLASQLTPRHETNSDDDNHVAQNSSGPAEQFASTPTSVEGEGLLTHRQLNAAGLSIIRSGAVQPEIEYGNVPEQEEGQEEEFMTLWREFLQ